MSVAILGGNPSGVAAGIRSARLGAETVILNVQKILGGMWTHGLGQTDRELDFARWGILSEFEARNGVYANTSPHLFPTPQAALAVFNDMVASEPNLRVVHGVDLQAVDRDPATKLIRSITCSGVVYSASNYVDATDTLDLAAMVGCMMRRGRESIAMTREQKAGVRPMFPVNASAINPVTGQRLKNLFPRKIERLGEADRRQMAYGKRAYVTQHASRRQWADLPVTFDREDYRYAFNIAVAQGLTTIPGSIGRELLPVVGGVEIRDMNNGGGGLIGLNWVGKFARWYALTPAQRRALDDAHTLHVAGLFKCICTDSEWAAALPALVADTKSWGLVDGLAPDSIVPGFFPLMYEREAGGLFAQAEVTQQASRLPGRNGVPEPISVVGYRDDSHYPSIEALADGRIGFEDNDIEPDVKPTVYQMPFGALKPRRNDIRNLIVARGTGGTRLGRVNDRIELSYMKQGDVCGMAAGWSDIRGLRIADLDYTRDMLPQLIAANAILQVPGVI